jgi:hypothetical protein
MVKPNEKITEHEPTKQQQPNKLVYYFCLVACLVLCLASHLLTDTNFTRNGLNENHLGWYVIIQFTLLSLLMLIIWRLSQKSKRLKDFRALLIIAVLARLVLIGVEPYSSNDVDRYLFDGRIALAGFDPYRISHDAIALTELRNLWQPPAEHAKYTTLYPPLALALFSLAASTGVDNATLTWQLMLIVASLISLALAILILKKTNKLHHLPLIALSPILILESSMALHLDTFSTLAVLMVIYAWQQQRLILAGIAIGLGALIKILPLVLLLPLCLASIMLARIKYPDRSERFKLPSLLKSKFILSLTCAWQLAISAIIVVSIGYLAAFFLGLQPIGSISVFFQKWRFAAPLFSFFETNLSTIELLSLGALLTTFLITVISYLSINSGIVSNAGQRNNLLPSNLLVALQLALALPLLLSPVLFTWYLMPLVALIALKPSFYGLAWLLIMPLSYEVLNQFYCCQVWVPAQWPLFLLGALYLSTLLHGLWLLYSVKHSAYSLPKTLDLLKGNKNV